MYLLTIASFFIIFYSLDKFLGVHYEPKEYELKQKKHVEAYVQNSLQSEYDRYVEAEPELETPSMQEVKEASEEPLEDDEGFKYYQDLKAKYVSSVLSHLSKHKARTDVVVRYYHHAPDGNSAYALTKLGYYIHERPVASQYADFQSNAVFYGDSVNLDDIQLVTFTLLNEGLPIKDVKPSRYSGSWKSKSIEIGTDTTRTNDPTLTYTEVKNLVLK